MRKHRVAVDACSDDQAHLGGEKGGFPQPTRSLCHDMELTVHNCEEPLSRGVSEKEITLKRGSWG